VDSNVVFRKTSKGLEEIERRIYRLSPRERLLLIQVDGKRSLAALAGKMGLEREGLDTAAKLLTAGFIEIAPGMAPPMSAPVPVRRESAAALLTGTLPPARPASAALLQTSPPPARGAAPARPAPPSTAATMPAAPDIRVAADSPRAERRPANWLTSTVAHLTNLFSGADDNGGGNGEARPPPSPSRPPSQASQGASRRHAALASSVAHEPVIDLTAAAEPEFARRPSAPDRVAPPLAKNPTAVPAPAASQDALQAQLAAKSAHEPVLDLTESFEPHVPEYPAATTAVAAPALVVPPTPLAAATTAAVDCPQRSACAGCARCPGNSVSQARNFMKDCLGRFTSHGSNSLTETLDECRTLADLQRQFEPWLRKLLSSGEGIAQAPALAARLQRLLLQ